MNLSQLLCAANGGVVQKGSIGGICVMCNEETEYGLPMKKVVSSNFTGWNKLFAGDCICPACAYIFSDQTFRKKSWVAWQNGFKTFKNDEAEEILFNPPEPPFFIYIAKRGQKQSWLTCLYRVAHSRETYFFAHEEYDVPIMFNRTQAGKMVAEVRRALEEYKLNKTELRTGQFKMAAWKKAYQGGYCDWLKRLQQYAGNPLWGVMVDVVRPRQADRTTGKPSDRTAGNYVQLGGLA